MTVRLLVVLAAAVACGCAGRSAAVRARSAIDSPTIVSRPHVPAGPTADAAVSEERGIRLVGAEVGEVPPSPEEAAASVELPSVRHLSSTTLPIDITSVVRLINENSPTVGLSQARVREAHARAEAADVLWLPNLAAGMTYNRFDGQTQNQRGEVFGVSRSNLFGNGAVVLSVDPAEAIYRPLIEWRVASAEQQRAVATSIAAELDAVLAYLDLLYVHGLLEINAETLRKGDALLKAAVNAQEAKLDRSPGDVNRVRTEVLLRRQERLDLVARASAASARLGKLLLIDPGVRLVPQIPELVPITLISLETPLAELLSIATHHRQDLAANRELIAAAWERVHKAQRGPFLPKIQVVEQGGTFGGGKNDDLGDFSARNSVSALVYWEVRNLGLGNLAEERERRAGVDQSHFQLVELQARVAAEVVESAEVALAKSESLGLAEAAVKEASELYRINQEGTFHVVDAKNLFDALRPLQALQFLNQARQNYIAAVLDYTRAQYRLHAALGCPETTVVLNE